jgi:hypothetical protein
VFVGSSSESLDVAYAIQENLERDAEITVWTQGILDLSKFTLDGLLDGLDNLECGVFILAPDDVVKMRGAECTKARDNVVFELGIFIGRLGKERIFIILPRGEEDFELPTDLLGLTPGTYEPHRTDGNLVAALGPACNKIRTVLLKFGHLAQANDSGQQCGTVEPKEDDENDIISIIESWLGARPARLNTQVIRYTDVDRELQLAPGTAEKYLPRAAERWGYLVSRKGKQTIVFREKPPPGPRVVPW